LASSQSTHPKTFQILSVLSVIDCVASMSKPGLGLEAFKFLTYLAIPIGATVVYADPKNMRKIIDNFQFIEFPPDEMQKARQERLREKQSTGK